MTPQLVLRTYVHAKDENRPHLLTGVFATAARLEIRDRSGKISFPAVTVGREAIADVLVRNFNQSYENIYTFCLDRPAADAASFSCDWLVGMTEKQTRNVRVGCGRYDWTFEADPVALATRLVITIDSMVVLTPDASQPVLRWLVGMRYPWSSTAEVAAAPPLEGVEPVIGYLCGSRAYEIMPPSVIGDCLLRRRRLSDLNDRRPSMLSGSCHCGAVRIEIPFLPESVTLCNCSICRRYGGLWAHFKVGTVRVTGHPEQTDAYVWGDRTLRTVRCRHCGCVTHWEPLEPKPDEHMAVNIRNFDPNELESLRIRRFDGAVSWTYLD